MLESVLNVPGFFVLLFFLAAILVKKYRLFFFLFSILFYLLSTYYIGNKLITPLEKPYNIPLEETKVDGVVILGGGHYKGSSNLPLAESAFKRLMYGIMIAKKRNLPIIYAGAGNELESAQLCIDELNDSFDLNLTANKDKLLSSFSIVYTHDALNTQQNAEKTAKIFYEHNITKPKIYLVTSATHMRRAKALFQEYNMKVVPAATDFKSRSDSCYCFYYPTINGLYINNIVIHETLGRIRDILKSLIH